MAAIEIHDGEPEGLPVVVGCPWPVGDDAAPTAATISPACSRLIYIFATCRTMVLPQFCWRCPELCSPGAATNPNVPGRFR